MNEASKRILEELQHSYECLFVKTGIEPNYFLLSSDIYYQLLQQEEILYELKVNSIGIKYINGIDVLLVSGEKIAKAAIIDEQQSTT
ncbi:hypothetical protein [Eubacterium sp.]|uniref:hypothetical protein n=1 Tax=Eubacterium sp. TaxID=142586 RepID=UPI003A9072E7